MWENVKAVDCKADRTAKNTKWPSKSWLKSMIASKPFAEKKFCEKRRRRPVIGHSLQVCVTECPSNLREVASSPWVSAFYLNIWSDSTVLQLKNDWQIFKSCSNIHTLKNECSDLLETVKLSVRRDGERGFLQKNREIGRTVLYRKENIKSKM